MRRSLYFCLSLLPLVATVWTPQGEPAEPQDPIERLKGTTLEFEPRQGYLRSLLAALKIDPASQTLVFSKTSRQSNFIGPKTPRALYFNQDTYVGWIPGAPLIEIITIHPTRGTHYYTLRNDRSVPAEFRPETKDCTLCHGRRGGLFASSSRIGPAGYPAVFAPSFNVTPALALEHRWGGWYVTGTHGAQRHMGNVVSTEDDESILHEDRGANVTDLRRFLDVGRYLGPDSDIVALMVMESQMDVQDALERTATEIQSGAEISEACRPLVRALLSSDEVKLTAPIKGTSAFATRYEESAIKDAKGRSLSQLDLKTRLQKYPCSPLIYSPSFDALPPAAKEEIGKQILRTLFGKGDESPSISSADRKTLLEILRETKPGLLPES